MHVNATHLLLLRKLETSEVAARKGRLKSKAIRKRNASSYYSTASNSPSFAESRQINHGCESWLDAVVECNAGILGSQVLLESRSTT